MSELSKVPLESLLVELAKRTDDPRVNKTEKGNIKIQIVSEESESEGEEAKYLALKAKYEPNQDGEAGSSANKPHHSTPHAETSHVLPLRNPRTKKPPLRYSDVYSGSDEEGRVDETTLQAGTKLTYKNFPAFVRTFNHRFDGDPKKLTSFISKCDAFHNCCPAEWLDDLYFTFADSPVERAGSDYSQVHIASWPTLRGWLRRTYAIKSTYDVALVDLSKIIQRPDKRIMYFSFRITEQSRFIRELGLDEGLLPETLEDIVPRAQAKQLINGTIPQKLPISPDS